MKRTMSMMLAISLAALMLGSCGGGAGADSSTSQGGTSITLNAADYETDAVFTTFADLPPNPNSAAQLQLYKDLGMNVCLLTEDNTSFTSQGKITEGYKKAIENIGDAGMQVWIRNMYNDPDYFQNTDAEKERSNYGTPYTMEARNVTDELSKMPQITGYYMGDEIYMESHLSVENYGKEYAAMDKFGKLIDWKNQYAPDAFWHMNHVPSQSYDHWMSYTLNHDYTYKMFLEYYVENILSHVQGGSGRTVCLDNYPFGEVTDNDISASFLVDLLTGALVTRNYNQTAAETEKATFGMCVQTFKNTKSRTPLRYTKNAAEVSFQMFTGMALGARLYEYFCFRSLPSIGIYGIIDEAGNPTDQYDMLKEANEKVLPFAKVMFAFDWHNLVLSLASDAASVENENSFDGAKALLEEDPSSKGVGVLSKTVSQYDAIVGCFKKGEQDGYMVVNYAKPGLSKSNIVRVTFENCTQALVYRNGVATTQKLFNGTLSLTLGAGDAAFVIPA